jgi:heme exporter protein B
MSIVLKILKRDLTRAARSGGNWAFGLVFMAIFLALSAIALDGKMAALRQLGVPLIWLALTFASLMSVDKVFAEDLQDGTTGQLWLSGVSYLTQAAAGILSFALIYLLPLILTAPIWSLLFDLSSHVVIGLVTALVCALPGLAAFTALAGALTGARGKGGFLAIFISAPLLVPILIFGVAATRGYADAGFAAVEFRALIGLSLLALALSIPASAAALAVNTDR